MDTATNTFLLPIGIFVIAIIIVIVGYFVRRDESFEGEVVDKETRTQMDHDGGFPSEFHYLKIKTTAGAVKSWQVKKAIYESTMIGDHVVKVKGQSQLTVSSKSAPPNVPVDAPKV